MVQRYLKSLEKTIKYTLFIDCLDVMKALKSNLMGI